MRKMVAPVPSHLTTFDAKVTLQRMEQFEASFHKAGCTEAYLY
jgi:hypothetical protein